MSPINNLFIVPLVSLVIYPLSLAIFLFPNLSFIFNLSINLLQFIESLLIKINVFTIAIPKLSLIFIIIYYILLLLIILKRKMKLIIVILIMLITNTPNCNYPMMCSAGKRVRACVPATGLWLPKRLTK